MSEPTKPLSNEPKSMSISVNDVDVAIDFLTHAPDVPLVAMAIAFAALVFRQGQLDPTFPLMKEPTNVKTEN